MNDTCLPLVQDSRACDPSLVGAKAANLAVALAAGFPALPGFVLTTKWTLADLDAALEAHDTLSVGGSLAVVVRSSSTGEDGASSSMAGVFESVTDVVGKRSFVDAVERVRASAETARPDGLATAPMGVLVQPMLAPRWGGVLFGADPVGERRNRMLVSAGPGGPAGLVAGETDAWTAVLDRSGRVRKVLATGPGDAVLPAVLLRSLADLARDLEELFGDPQDVEWAFDDDRGIVLLQARPITTGGRASGPTFGPGPLAESFPDPLAPLEQELWLEPIRDGLRNAIRLAGGRSRRALERSPLVIATGGGVAAADLGLMGVPTTQGLLRRLDPRPPARRLRVAWRVGRLRAAFPELAGEILHEVDGHLADVPTLRLLNQEELITIVRNARGMLPSLHGYEALAGLLIPSTEAGPTGSSVALQIVGEAIESGRPMRDVAEEEPAVLALVPPRIGPDRTLSTLCEVARFEPPSSGGQLEVTDRTALAREAVRMRVRWVQELMARATWELAGRLEATGRLPSRDSVRLLSVTELERAACNGVLPPDLRSRREAHAGELPAQFRLSKSGRAVAVSSARPRRRGARGAGAVGAGGGVRAGLTWQDTGVVPLGAVLVVSHLDPRLAPLIPRLSGLIAETGSPLSHLAILAREHHVAVVVGYQGARELLPTGTQVEVDGSSGEVRIEQGLVDATTSVS